METPALSARQSACSLAGMLLVAFGALTAIVGTFLPYAVSPDPRVAIVGGSVFEIGPGLWVLAGGLAALALAVGRWRGVPMPWGIPSMLGLFGVVVSGLTLLDVDHMSLYGLAYRGPYHASTAELEPGAGLWVVGAGALVTVLGGLCFAAVPMALQQAVAAAAEPPAPSEASAPGAPAAPPAPAPEPRTGPAWEDAREAPVRRWAPPVAPGSLPPWDDSTTPTSR